jgi:TolB-like protein/DNA-binding winged helix-turn-helix (wHTH) protein/Flp pilus assembly protein TadD
MQKSFQPAYTFEGFTLDLDRGCLLQGREEVRLRPKSYEALKYLVENSGRLVSKEELMKALWPDSFVTDDSLVKCLRDVRLALGDHEQHYIKTVPRRGYLFSAQVSETDTTATGPNREDQVEGIRVVIEEGYESKRERLEETENRFRSSAASTSIWRRLQMNRAFLPISLVLIGLAVVLSYSWISARSKLPATRMPRSIAVLPFTSLSSNSSDEYLGLGMADTLITKLSSVGQIIVRPTSAVRRYSATDQDPVAAGQEQRVEAVLEGNIQRSGEKIRVTARLLNVQDGFPLWAEKFDEKFTDILAVEDSISEKLTKALALKLTGEERKLLAKRYTENAQAHELFLKGKYFWNKRTEEALKKGIEYFQQAIEADPEYALAYSGLAESYIVLGSGGLLAPTEAVSKARAAVVKALEIDDLLGEAHSDLGAVYCSEWNWSEGEREFKRALELSPNYPTGHMTFAWYLMPMGRFDEAIAEAKRAQELDPLSLVINNVVGISYEIAGQPDQAIEQYRKELEMDPNFIGPHRHLGWIYLQKGEFSEAFKEYQKAFLLSGGSVPDMADQAYAFAISGNRSGAIKTLEHLKRLSKQQYVSPYLIAKTYAGLGEKDQSFEWLEKACEEHAASMIFLKVEPCFDGLRSDPRFQEMVRRIGLQ